MEPAKKKKKYQDYSQDQLNKALEEVKKGLSLRKAAEKFGVSKSTLNRSVNEKNRGKVGRPFVFNEETEKVLAECIALAGDWGFPLILHDIQLIVKSFLDRKGVNEVRLRNNLPGWDWASSFVKRHSDLLTKILCQNVKRSRAAVSIETLNAYFDELQTTLKDVKPHLIINYDETNLVDDPGRKNVIVQHGTRHPERILDSSKSSNSVMFSGTAAGKMFPPYIVYRAENLYSSWCENGPKGTIYNLSKNGWFTMELFEDFFRTIIVPYFKNYKEEPKVLIGANLASHVSPWVIQYCVENNIRFVLLPLNSTGLCQPVDVAVFKPLKVKWRETLEEWKNKNRGSISKDVFPWLLNKCLGLIGEEAAEKNLKSGFKAAGIFPLDREQVIKRLPKKRQYQ